MLSFDTSICPASIDVQDSSILNPKTEAWKFTDEKNNKTYNGTINVSHFLITPESALLSFGNDATVADTTFEIGFTFRDKQIKPGTFYTDSLNHFSFSAKGICIDCAWEVAYKLSGAKTTIVIENYDAVTKQIKGSFYGTAIDSRSTIASIKDGEFNAYIK